MPRELKLDGVVAGYGPTIVLEDISLSISQGETLTILGRNGVGKSTLLDTIMGLTTLHSGTITFDGRALTSMRPEERATCGLGYVPQERLIFPSLTVEQNLRVAARDGRWGLRDIYELFPHLGERRTHQGNHLSGGEQQMLAVARTLMTNPQVLLLDEPLEGLAPIIVEELMGTFEQLSTGSDFAIILVEQHARKALDFAERAIVLDRGKVAHAGPSDELLAHPEKLADLIGLSSAEARVDEANR